MSQFKMKKKSQAAMEFLLTYGWAILAVLTAISALAYFGLLDPTKWFATNTCTLPVGLSCLDSRVYVQGTSNRLELHLKNNLGSQIKITAVDIAYFNNKHSTQNRLLGNGAKTEPNNIIVLNMNNGMPILQSNQKYDFDFTIDYTNTDTMLPHTINGHVRGTVN